MHQISGNQQVSINSVEPYSVSPANGSMYNWVVSGGTIISGQGTSRIDVEWDTEGACSVEVDVDVPGEQLDIVVIDVECS